MLEKKEEKSKSEQDKIYRHRSRVNKLFFNFLLETTEKNLIIRFGISLTNKSRRKRTVTLGSLIVKKSFQLESRDCNGNRL
jgi:hypothetical protein